jgi:hypothetical protein
MEHINPNPPPVQEDPRNPDLPQWQKESREWFNSDPPLDYTPKESIDNSLNEDELLEKYGSILGEIKCVFVVLDGTLFNVEYNEVTPTPGAVQAFKL